MRRFWPAIGAIVSLVALNTPDMGRAQMPGMSFDPNASYPCCNRETNEIIGEMPMQACAMKPKHAPKLPGMAGAMICPEDSAGSGGGGTAEAPPSEPPTNFEEEPVWEEFKPNLPNGGFESWRGGGKPVGFTTYSMPDWAESPPPELRNMETVRRTTESFEGSSAAEIANFKPEGRLAGYDIVIPGGTVSCKPGCPVEKRPAGAIDQDSMQIEIAGAGPALCGAYKDFLKGGDKLHVVAALYANAKTPIGGTSFGNIRNARLSQDEDGWIKFRIPITNTPGNSISDARKATLQFQILPGAGVPGATRSVMGAGAAVSGTGATVTAGSRAIIDAVHFCGGIDLQVTDAESAGGFLVPEEHEEKGAIVWVNLDNDDGDDKFDNKDEKVEGEDDDFAQLLLQLPSGAKGKVTLKQVGGQGKTRLWTGKTRTPGEAYAGLNKPMTLPEGFTDNGAFLEKVLWVEGLEPSASTSDVQFELTYEPDGGKDPETDKIAVTVLAVDNMKWHGKDNSRNDDEILDPDPNHPIIKGRAGGPAQSGNPYDDPVRVFPGKRYVDNKATGEVRSKVELEVILNVEPPRKTQVHLRAFDVDDPSADDDEVDDETKADDNRGEKPAGSGMFTKSKSDTLALEISEKTAKAEFQVTMQPGDNFRVAAAGDEDFLKGLINDDTKLGDGWENLARIVDQRLLSKGKKAEDAEVQKPESYLSDTLTVWRFLHVELDSMEPVEGNIMRGNVTSITPAGTVQGIPAWTIGTTLNIVVSDWPSDGIGGKGQWDRFFGGQMRLDGVRYSVVGNTARGAPDDITVVGSALNDETYRKTLMNKSFEIEDDDMKPVTIAGNAGQAGPFSDGAVIPLPPDDRLQDTPDNAYFPAYVFPRTDTLKSGPGTRKFIGNLRIDTVDYVRRYFGGFSQKDNHNDPDLWTVYLLGALQGVHWEDADGKHAEGGEGIGGVAGEADGERGTGGLIYWASGSELEQTNGSGPGWRLIDATVHEIGHLFGGDHTDTGLMSDGENGNPPPTGDFSDVTLDKIRSAKSP
ncbi:MAG: hypothetical protein ACE363_11710 [Alphaproteobacteria bacterium]